jgi:hypothetical protein
VVELKYAEDKQSSHRSTKTMCDSDKVNPNPEEEELQKKLAELLKIEEELFDRELELETIRVPIHTFESDYIDRVGRRYSQLDQLRAETANARAASDQFDEVAMERAQRSQQQAVESAFAAGDSRPDGWTSNVSPKSHEFQPSQKMKTLFKQCVRMFHPDLVMDESEKVRRQVFLKRLNGAYGAGDEDGIRNLFDEWNSSPENVEGDGAGAQLVRVIRQIAQIQKRLNEI